MKGWGDGGEPWEWRQRLWDWEEVLVGECSALLANVVFQVTIDDHWKWRLYNSVYDMLTTDESNTMDEVSDMIWHRHIQLKVSILACRLHCNRLPTKANLVARGMITEDVQLCVSGCGEVETAQHLFVSCPIFRELWSHVREWVGVCGVDPFSVYDYFLQFTYLAGGATSSSFMQLLWLLCVWVL